MVSPSILRHTKGDDLPTAPDAAHEDLYAKSDGKWYRRGSDGVEHLLEGVDAAFVAAAITAAQTSAVTNGDTTHSPTGDAVFDFVTAAAAAVLATSIVDGDLTHAPDGNAVFDALALKAPLASPALTGNPTAPTASPGDNDTSIATTAFVTAADAALVIDSIADADTTHAPSRNAVFDALALKAPLASPALTGTPTAPTAAPGTNTTQVATTAFVTAADVALAAAILTATITNGDTTHAPNGDAVFDALALKADLASPTFTGDPKAPTPSVGDNDTSIATTAYVVAEIASRIAALDAVVYKGVIDASANPNYPAADAGHLYVISVAGKIGGASGVDVEAGDLILCKVDGSAAGNQATVGANWDVIQTNIVGAVTGPASSTTGNVPTFNGTSGKVIQDSGVAVSSLAALASPTFTGDPKAPTPSPGDSDTSIATTAFVAAAITAGGFAPLASPTFTGDPKAPTASVGDNDTSIATTAFVNAEIASDAPNVTLTAAGSSPNANAASLSGQALTLQPSSASFAGNQSAVSFRKQRDDYTDAVNDLGIDPTGSVDATAILTAWIGTLPAGGGGRLQIPANTRMRVDGPVAVNKDNITIQGVDRRSSIIGTGSATANQFNVTGDGVTFSNLRFEAGTTAQNLALRTAGYCVEIQAASNGSNVFNVDAIGHWSGINLEGCQLPTIDDFNMREYGANATAGALIRVNTNSAGGDTLIRRLQSDNGSNIANYAGVRVINTASLIMEACNIIHATVGLAIETANAGTVPSIKATDCFFDNGTHGLRFNPTGTGVWYRSEFVNCWFGSNTTAGISFASAQFEGIEFTNCKILGNPVGVQATSGGGKFTLNGGCVIAGSSTAGVDLAASTNMYPMIQGCRIGTSGAFGVNAIGIRIAAGAYKGIIIQGCDVSDNTSALSLGAVTIAGATAADYQRFRITDNAGINPRGTNVVPVSPPVAATTYTNTSGFRVQVIHKQSVAPTAVTLNGVLYTVGFLANQLFTVTLEPGGTISFTAGTHTSWQWITQ